jgi:hypothetical protein
MQHTINFHSLNHIENQVLIVLFNILALAHGPFIMCIWGQNFCEDFMLRSKTYCYSWLTRDKEEMEEIRQAKVLEEEKAQFAVIICIHCNSALK